MKLKYLIAALGLTACAASQATILNSSNTGGSELFLSVWEQGATTPDQSFTIDLGITESAFLAGDTVGATLATLTGSTDSVWNSMLTTSTPSALQWAVLAGNTLGQPSVLGTVQVGQEGTLSTATTTNGFQSNTTVALTQIDTFLAAVNTTGTHGTATNGESLNPVGDNAYFQGLNLSSLNGKSWLNSNAIGATAEVVDLSKTVGRPTPATSALTVLPGTLSFSQQGGSYVLSYNVSAVPEPTGSTMVLAGLGIMGFVATRRRKQ